jgi:hypothetical protein
MCGMGTLEGVELPSGESFASTGKASSIFIPKYLPRLGNSYADSF